MHTITKYHLLLLIAFFSWLPALLISQITGKVTDESGEPLPYATVYIRNTSNGTVTNAKGEFQLTVAKGEYEVVFQYLGYKTKVEPVKVENKQLRLDVRLEPSNLELNEVVISSEDPAERIMRQVINKRKYYKNKVGNYTCDAYVKGFYKLLDAPKKVLGQDVGNMGGILDTNRAGVLYLSESVSKVYCKTPPIQKKEVMISSKVSGNENGYSINRATLTDFDLYDEHLEIEREILSPLADNAFAYYNFKYKGSYVDLNGMTIEIVQVIPKRPADPTFSGQLYIVDSWWNLAGVDLALTGASIKQPVLDTLRIQQQFVLLDKPDTWRVLTQVTSFKFGIFGFKISGFFNSVFSNYNINPVYEPGFFDREFFKVEKTALDRDSSYWTSARPVPLTEEEQKDYTKKDSLQKIWKSKAFLDSMDRKSNRFKPMNLLMGYTWENSYKHRSVSYPAALQWIQFNTVQGWLVDIKPEWQRDSDERGNKYWRATGNLNYGFSEKKLRGWLNVRRRFESINYTIFELSGGTTTEQFNARKPIGAVVNGLYSLWGERNYMKLYDKTYVHALFGRTPVPGFTYRISAEWAQRTPLINHTDFSWRKGDESRYTPNTPIPALDGVENFEARNLFVIDVNFRFRFKEKYSSYPDYRLYHGTNLPILEIRYRSSIPKILDADADFDFVAVNLSQSSLSWGLAGYTRWNVDAGLFVRKKNMSFMDFYHPMGNQTFLTNRDNYTRSFLMLPYYAYSTNKPYFEAHAQHHLQGWLLDKIPLVRKLNWKEVFGAGVYYADQPSLDPAFTGELPYWELNFGFENIGIKAFRNLRLDVVWGFFGSEFYKTGFMVGFNL
ncbi:MAG: carboxypeptidase-like regulatory domain-containing protein [Saprospiraceae bacterium]|nr:carboxypeptidase-like regulatory domain-containing protein [Saprospiraceae bacterium]